jgi:ribonucleotide reductase alpha subunit
VFSTDPDGLGGRWVDRVQALAQWWHAVASNEALDLLHQAMDPISYHRISMAIKIASDLPAFFVVVNFVVGLNRSQRLCHVVYLVCY